MSKRWTQTGHQANYAVKLGQLALRAQRLVVARKIDALQSMLDMHAPALSKTPEGKEALAKIRQHFDETKRAL